MAYDFWRLVKAEQAKRGWTDVELERRSGISRNTVNALQRGKRPPSARVVNGLADVLGIDQQEAHELAGLVPRTVRTGAVSAREAIMADSQYTEKQRQQMLDLLDLFERVNEVDQRRAS